MDKIEVMLDQHIKDEDCKYARITQEIQELRNEIKELTLAWNQAKGVVIFLKWCSVAAGGFVTFFLFMKEHWK